MDKIKDKNSDSCRLKTAANNVKRKKKAIEHWEVIAFYLFVYDILAMNFAYFLGLWMRFDFHFSNIPKEYLYAFLKFAPFYTVFSIVVFYFLRLYKSIWRFASFNELNRILFSSLITAAFHTIGITAFRCV